VVLGGEHTVSVGAVQAIAESHPDLVAVVLDAHADLRNEYQGSPFSHACATRRISEICPVVQVGVRSFSREEAEFLRGRDWHFIPAKKIRPGSDWISEAVSPIRGRPVYLSIDLDALDPSIMPAVGTPEPGGMSWAEVLSLTSEIARQAEVVAFDVVELAPIPGLTAPDFLAAELIYKIMGSLT
jgi:agmatinase